MSAQAISTLSRSRGEPEWLTAQRLSALSRALETPAPTRSTEGWRRTDLTGLDLDSVLRRSEPPIAGAALRATATAGDSSGIETAGELRLTDEYAALRSLAADLESKGVLLLPMDEAVRSHPELLRLGLTEPGPNASRIELLNAALWTAGIFVYAPRGVTVGRPLLGHVRAASGAPVLFRNVIVAGEGAELTYVDQHDSADASLEPVVIGAVDIVTGQASRVRYANLQSASTGTWFFNHLRSHQGRDSRVDWLLVGVGGRLHRAELEAGLDGQGSETDILGLVFGDGKQHFDHQTTQNHVGNDSQSDLDIKAALAGESSSNFTGMIRVNKTTLRTSSNLENRNLLLSDSSHAESDPRLEILNSDVVRCAHGATVGPLDKEMIFYIQSRGVPADEAQRLVVEAFFEPVLQKIPVESLRLDVWRTIQRKLGRTVSATDRPSDILAD
ncbi:MAG: Fe-S cluster assembly protein SufD [Chloroflexota bacterium]